MIRLDQLRATYHRQTGDADYSVDRYGYTKDGDVRGRRVNGDASTVGGDVTGGRRTRFRYDTAGWLTHQADYGFTGRCDDDRRIDTTFTPTGLPTGLTIKAASTTCTSGDEGTNPPEGDTWTDVKQTTTKTYYPNQVLKTLTTKDRHGTTVESHDLAYTDAGGNYVGTRTRDTYRLDHPDSTACAATTCTARWTYDPRGRLVEHTDGHGGTTTYTLDAAGNVVEETTPEGTTTRSHTGDRLATATTGGTTFDYFYDPLGNLDCITTAAGTHGSCNSAEGASVPAELVTDHTYDWRPTAFVDVTIMPPRSIRCQLLGGMRAPCRMA